MANIKIELGHPVIDGMPLSFRAPCNCNEVTGIKVEWQDGDEAHFIVFSFTDAHGNDLTGIGNLFSTGSMVRVVLDTTNARAFIQNADTNAYLENRFRSMESGSVSANAVLYTEQTLTPEQQEQARKNIGITGTGLPDDDNDETGVLTAIDFSNFENGSFTETVDGQVITHAVTFDSSGRPNAIDGVTITWGDV